jgi:hypothetical protein
VGALDAIHADDQMERPSGALRASWTLPSALLLLSGCVALVLSCRRVTGLSVATPTGPRSRSVLALRVFVALACIWVAALAGDLRVSAAAAALLFVATVALGRRYDRALRHDQLHLLEIQANATVGPTPALAGQVIREPAVCHDLGISEPAFGGTRAERYRAVSRCRVSAPNPRENAHIRVGGDTATMTVRTATSRDPVVCALRDCVPAQQAALDRWIWEADEMVVGDGAAAAVRHSPLHPRRTWVAVAAAPDCPPNLLVMVVSEARRRANGPLKLRAWNGPQLDSLLAAGAMPLIDSHTVEIDGDRPATASWRDATAMGDVVQRSALDQAALGAAWALYRRIHAWDPVAPGAPAPEGWCDDVIVSVTVDDATGRPVGVGLAHQGDPPEAAIVGTVLAGFHEAPMTASLLASLLRRCGRLEIEADDGPGAHTALISTLRQIPGATWQEPLHVVEIQ